MIRTHYYSSIMTIRDEISMVETPEGRIRLLKNGIKYKTIEELYIKYNGLKLVKRPILFNFTEASLRNCFDSPGTSTIECEEICS